MAHLVLLSTTHSITSYWSNPATVTNTPAALTHTHRLLTALHTRSIALPDHVRVAQSPTRVLAGRRQEATSTSADPFLALVTLTFSSAVSLCVLEST